MWWIKRHYFSLVGIGKLTLSHPPPLYDCSPSRGLNKISQFNKRKLYNNDECCDKNISYVNLSV